MEDQGKEYIMLPILLPIITDFVMEKSILFEVRSLEYI